MSLRWGWLKIALAKAITEIPGSHSSQFLMSVNYSRILKHQWGFTKDCWRLVLSAQKLPPRCLLVAVAAQLQWQASERKTKLEVLTATWRGIPLRLFTFGKFSLSQQDGAVLLLPRKQYPFIWMSLSGQKNHKIRICKYLSCYLIQSKIVPHSMFSNALVLSNFKWFSFYSIFFSFLVPSMAPSDLESTALLYLVFTGGQGLSIQIKQMFSFT